MRGPQPLIGPAVVNGNDGRFAPCSVKWAEYSRPRLTSALRFDERFEIMVTDQGKFFQNGC